MLNRRQAVLGRENSGVQTDFDFEEQITQEVQTEVTHEEFALPLYIPSTVVEEKGIQTEETEVTHAYECLQPSGVPKRAFSWICRGKSMQ